MGGAADERVRVGGQRVVHVVPHQRRRRRRRVVLSLFLKCMLVYDRLRETRLWDQTPDKAKRSLSRNLSTTNRHYILSPYLVVHDGAQDVGHHLAVCAPCIIDKPIHRLLLRQKICARFL